jgi:hypothetical protein
LEHFPDSHLSGICIVYFPDIFLTFSGHLFFIGKSLITYDSVKDTWQITVHKKNFF